MQLEYAISTELDVTADVDTIMGEHFPSGLTSATTEAGRRAGEVPRHDLC